MHPFPGFHVRPAQGKREIHLEAFLASLRFTDADFVQVKGNIMLATKLDTVLKSAQAQSKA